MVEGMVVVGIRLQAVGESSYWIEIPTDSGLVRPERLDNLHDEAEQLVAVFAASDKTAKRRTDIAKSP